MHLRSGMAALMHSQLEGCDECFSTLITSVGLLPNLNTLSEIHRLPQVNLHVSFEMRAMHKSHPTLVTAVRLVSSVNTQVHFQVKGRCKCFSAMITGATRLSLMSPQVSSEMRDVHESHPTVLASMRPLSRVDALVHPQVEGG